MVYMKYLLGQTGLFPKWEPKVEDVLYAASCVRDVKHIVTPRRNHYYYVRPNAYDIRSVYSMLPVFRANGVILRPHRSHNYHSIVFRVPNRGQRFMHDVMRVTSDSENFHKVLQERGIENPSENLLRAFEKLKYQQR
ncbi:MAG: hypothetical protein IJQ90_04735 [Alphaproteobacteria bacterium]|nr:hypothetical protein [Alphaproteobacteria bacterium]